MYWIRIDNKRLTFLPGDQRREDYTDPFFSSSQSQSSAGGHIHNHGRSNTTYTLIDNAFNDNSEHHCKYESTEYPSHFLKSVQLVEARVCLPPINNQESGLEVSQCIEKIQFPILMVTKILNPNPKLCLPIYNTSIRGCVRPSQTRKSRGRSGPHQRKMVYRTCLEIPTTTTSKMKNLCLRPHPRLLCRLRLAVR